MKKWSRIFKRSRNDCQNYYLKKNEVEHAKIQNIQWKVVVDKKKWSYKDNIYN